MIAFTSNHTLTEEKALKILPLQDCVVKLPVVKGVNNYC